MDPAQIYGIVAGGMFFVLLLYRMYTRISRWIQNRTIFYIFRYLIYPTLCRRRRFLEPITRWQSLLTLIYWLSTAVCNLVGVRTLPQAGSRAGVLSVLHLIPLLFTSRLSFAADLFGLSLKTYFQLHGSLGLMATLQGLIHILIYVTHNTFRISDPLQFYGLLVFIQHLLILKLTIFRVEFSLALCCFSQY